MKIATLAQSPVFGGRVKSVDDSVARAVKGVRQIVRLDDAVAVVADHMGAARKGLAALYRSNGMKAHTPKLTPTRSPSELEKATLSSGPVAQNIGDVDKAMANAVAKVEAIYQVPFLAHAAMEPMNCTVHVREDSCEVWVGTQALARAQAAAAKAAGLPLEKVVVHNHLIGGGFGRRLESDDVTRAVQIAQHVDGPVKVVWTREEDIQHDMYRPVLVRPDICRARCEGDASRLESPLCRLIGHRAVAPTGIQKRSRPRLDRRRDRSCLRASEFARRVFAGGTAGHSDGLLAQCRAIAQCLCDRKFRGRAGGGGEAGSRSFIGELSSISRLAQKPCSTSQRKRVAGDSHCQQGSAVASRCSSSSGPTWRRSRKLKWPKDGGVRVRRVVCAVDCGTVVNPDTVRAQIESAIIFGVTAALYGEITLKNGRVEQANFDTYQMLRMNEAPAIEVHIVQSSEPPGGMGESGTSAIVPAVANAIFAATGKRLRKMPVDTNALKQQG